MPHVSHYQLVQVADTAHLWDAEFRSFAAAIDKTPNDRTALGAFADWCDEHVEPELAQAARYLAKRQAVELMRGSGKSGGWWVADLPPAVAHAPHPDRQARDTPLGALASLYHRLNEARKELE